MCLIIVSTGAKLRATLLHTPGVLQDVFKSNPDGLGAMYTVSRQRLRTPRSMPKTLAEAQAFIAALPNDERTVAVHFRQRTHGATDITQCHPYDVIPYRVALMHNGILPHGNAPDRTKSDTWHYINGYLQPLLEAYPKAFMNVGVQNLIESDISTSNRFVMMDNEGDVVILNKETGIEYDGMWFSNTYAWSPELVIPDYRKPMAPLYLGGADDSDWYGGYSTGYKRPGSVLTHGTQGAAAAGFDDEGDEDYGAAYDDALLNADDSVRDSIAKHEADIMAAVLDMDTSYLTMLLNAAPRFVLTSLYRTSEFYPSEIAREGLDPTSDQIVNELADEDIPNLVHRIEVKDQAEAVAEAICWYGDWEPLDAGPEEDEDEDESEDMPKAPTTVAELFAA